MNTKDNESRFQFQPPALTEAIFLVNGNYKGNLANVGSTPLMINVQATDKKNDADGYSTALVAESVMTSKAIPQPQDENFSYYLRVTMASQFKWKTDSISGPNIDQFLAINAPSLILGYIRQVVVNLTESAEIKTQHIPFIDFASLKRETYE